MTIASTALDATMLARWQFGITTVYHFILVPFTIGMSLLVAIMQTKWHKTGEEYWLKATRFFGKLFLINFALGVATGIVQEFQFGMNWSEYSRFVGDIFGAPLACEALISFFMESTFLGLWIFGWGRLSKKSHLTCVWLVFVGVNTSALWIIGANSWMQHPVGATFDPETGRAQLDGLSGFFQVLLNPVLWAAYTHVLSTSWLLVGTFVAGIAIWWMVRSANAGAETEARDIWRPIARFGMVVVIVGGLLTAVTGHIQGQLVAKDQPAKMAAAEALCETPNAGEGAPFTIAAFGPLNAKCDEISKIGEVPGVYSFMATNSFTGKVEGLDTLNQKYGSMFSEILSQRGYDMQSQPVDFSPNIIFSFWSFRLMMLFGIFSAILAIWGLIATKDGRISKSTGLGKFAIWCLPMPYLATTFGWLFTEWGRQPFIVHPVDMEVDGSSVFMLTEHGLSFAVPAWQVLVTMLGFTLIYLALGIVWFLLIKRYVKEGVHVTANEKAVHGEDAGKNLSFAY
ncbi:cytochrome ubiquinol oxidase subunit I [Varibaculum cambriense]|uniref:cytochrome ubiquinol oxidase subunit I n=1 Tax=Varibaculum cambriense TaxID=184870 RepID=UPI00242CA377|nr:cytochrome ubiquinol oxidase subunit I [Varibaculum cambriense]